MYSVNNRRQRAREWQEPIPVWRATQDTYLAAALFIKPDALEIAIMNNKITIEPSYSKEEECCLCLDSMLNKTVSYTPCRHVFHTECFNMQYQYQTQVQKNEKIECVECCTSLYEATKTMTFPKIKSKKITEV